MVLCDGDSHDSANVKSRGAFVWKKGEGVGERNLATAGYC